MAAVRLDDHPIKRNENGFASPSCAGLLGWLPAVPQGTVSVAARTAIGAAGRTVLNLLLRRARR
jgi:hypothetical protein